MIRTIFYGAAAVVAVAFMTACGGAGAKRTNEGAGTETVARSGGQVIMLSDSLLTHRGSDTVELGRMKSGEVVMRNLVLRNAGETPVVITGLEKTCDCIGLKYPKAPILPGGEAEVEMLFDSGRLYGWVYKTIGIRTSLGAKSYMLVVTAEPE